ncbi:MAG: RICIN domain-containing protein [Ignavibacteriae bacterium]|nr:RICIN domain-containing protein [Ignavibacteriota bacterium]
MAYQSHPHSFHTIYCISDTDLRIHCDVDDQAELVDLLMDRGEFGAREQSWEIIYYPYCKAIGTTPASDEYYRFRNAQNVFLGVPTLASGQKLGAYTGLDSEYNEWILVSTGTPGEYYIKAKDSSLYLKMSGTEPGVYIELVDYAYKSIWAFQMSGTIPPMALFRLPLNKMYNNLYIE